MTTRRTVFAGIAAALMPGPLAAQAPTQGGMRRLGVLMTTLATDPAGLARAAAFVQGLGALGWKDGGNLSIDWRWAGGNPALFQRYAAEMVALVRRADGVRHRDRRPCSGARPIMSIAS